MGDGALPCHPAPCDSHIAPYDFGGLLLLVPIAVFVQIVAGFASGLYTGRSLLGSSDEVVSMVRATVLTICLLFIVNPLADPRLVPASVPIVAGVVALALHRSLVDATEVPGASATGRAEQPRREVEAVVARSLLTYLLSRDDAPERSKEPGQESGDDVEERRVREAPED